MKDDKILKIIGEIEIVKEIINVAIYHYVDKKEINDVCELEWGLKIAKEGLEEIKEELFDL